MIREKYKWVGTVVTLILVFWGIGVMIKNHKRDGFWMGFWALFLIISYFEIDKCGWKFKFGLFSLEVQDNLCTAINNDNGNDTGNGNDPIIDPVIPPEPLGDIKNGSCKSRIQ